MKNKFWFLFSFTVLFFNEQMLAQTMSLFKNDIIVPAKLYMLSGVQNDLFVEPFIKRWRPYDDVVRFSGTAKFSRRLERVASLKDLIDGVTINFTLVNQDNFDTVKTLSSTVIVGKPGRGQDSITVSIIGDSFTNGGFFKDALLVKNYVPKIKLIGLREVTDFPGQFDEGRGGWRLENYFTVSKSRTQPFNGFWQPDGAVKYWGATKFWKLANDLRLNPKGPWTFEESYFVARFTTSAVLFDSATGYKLNPKENDLMFDETLGEYVKYNGKKWMKVGYSDYSWSFNYGKYLAMWNLKAPLILAEFLGLNDFRSSLNPSKIDFTKWNKQIADVKNSYLKAVPNGKFVMMIPASTCGILDNQAGDFTTKQNASMWEVRKNIIQNFDNREAEGFYIVDAGIAIDQLNGYNFTKDPNFTNPYQEYQGKEVVNVQTGNPHPYPNYPSMGLSLAAFIQRYRK